MTTTPTKPKVVKPKKEAVVAAVAEPIENCNGIVLKVKRLTAEAVLPEQKTKGAIGFDICVSEAARLSPVTTTEVAYMVKTGIAVEIPPGYHGKLFLRSSTGLKTKLRLANGTGIIDSDYRGEIQLLVENVGFMPTILKAGSRIAQLIIEKNVNVTIQEVEELTETERDANGFGSTGN